MMNFNTIESCRVRLRAIEPEDIDLLYQIENNPNHWSAGHNRMPYSRFYLKNYLESLTGDIFLDRKLRLIIECKQRQYAVGIIDLYDLNPIYLKAEVGIIVFEAYRGQGYGKEATHLLAEYAFTHLLLNQVYATTSALNAASIALFKSCGFEQTARFKEWVLTQHGFEDELLFQRFADT